MGMDSFLQKAVENAKRFEGFRATPYLCPAGKITVGYGLNLERVDYPPKILEDFGSILVSMRFRGKSLGLGWKGLKISEATACAWLGWEMEASWAELKRARPWVAPEALAPLPSKVHLILLDMAYNMGISQLLRFPKMLAAMERQSWAVASVELMDSRYATQVGSRAREHRDTLKALCSFLEGGG